MVLSKLSEAGSKIALIDFGFDDLEYRENIPDLKYEELRLSDSNQNKYFLGNNDEGIPSRNIRVGAQLTPPRQFIVKNSEAFLPVSSENFSPLQASGLGGLGAAWGAACFTFDKSELQEIGIDDHDFNKYYSEVAHKIGISADQSDENTRFFFNEQRNIQKVSKIDKNNEQILLEYKKNIDFYKSKGLYLGRTPLAMLTEDKDDRKANPYFDMDFYSDSRKSIFRPKYIIEDLVKKNKCVLISSQYVIKFKDGLDFVEVYTKDVKTNELFIHKSKKLILCCGTINSARIVLNSFNSEKEKVPILSSPYTYITSINAKMFGIDNSESRHSLSQLCALFKTSDSHHDDCLLQFYSYRSLLLYKLIKEIPLPIYSSKYIVRLLQDSLSILGIFYSDQFHEDNYMFIKKNEMEKLPELIINFKDFHEDRARKIEKKIKYLLLKLKCLPFMRINPGNGSSIHYAGSLPFSLNKQKKFSTGLNYKLNSTNNVYVGDSSTWNYLPAKGLTYTVMANALRLASMLLKKEI
jgi:hypothetical protein